MSECNQRITRDRLLDGGRKVVMLSEWKQRINRDILLYETGREVVNLSE